MPEDAAWFWSRFLSFRLVKEDSASASADHGAVDAASPAVPRGRQVLPRAGPECQLAGPRRTTSCSLYVAEPYSASETAPFSECDEKAFHASFLGKKCLID